MKKIIFIFLLLFIFMTNTKAFTARFSLGESVPNVTIESKKGDDIHRGKIFVLTRRNDKQFVYCINPFKQLNIDNNYTGYYYNNSIFGLTNSEINKMNVISYYGYGYKNHTSIEWYAITQLLIWRTLNIDSYFIDDNNKKINLYESEINELENLVNDYYKMPSFSNNIMKYNTNSNYKILDTNNVLKNFNILKSDIDTRIENNELIVNTSNDGIFNIEFIKNIPINNDYILYNLNNYQSIFYPGKINSISFNLTIEVNSGSVTINKIDSENKKRIGATLKGAIYGLYNESELITTIETDEKGLGFIDNLSFGKYYIKELYPSLGYKIDENLYEFEITSGNKDIYINSYEDVIKGNIIINKYCGYDDNYELEDGAIFEIYDANNNLIGLYETINGVLNVSLEYGNYYVKQIKGLPEYQLVKDFIVDIQEDKDYVYNLYDKKEKIDLVEDLVITNKDNTDYNIDDLIVEVPNTSKNDYNYLIYLSYVFVGSILILISKMKKIDV